MTTARMPGRQHSYMADERAREQLDRIADHNQVEADFSIPALAGFAIVSMLAIVSFVVGFCLGLRQS